MRMRFLLILSLMALACAACVKKQTPEEIAGGTVVIGSSGPDVLYRGEKMSSIQGDITTSTVLTDGASGAVIIPGNPYAQGNEEYVDARELKLRLRELAEQLVAEMQDCSLKGTVALPVSFVNLNNFQETSAFGRLIGEQLFFELNQRGYPVREYRIPGNIRGKEGTGEFYLSREFGKLSPAGSVVVVGTYSAAPGAVFVNARLVRPGDGRVLRTANIVLANNSTVKRLLRMATVEPQTQAASGGQGMRIRDFDTATRPKPPQNLTPFDKGEDIH